MPCPSQPQALLVTEGTALPAPRQDEMGPAHLHEVIPSARLLRGRKQVQIEHNGARYLLRTTKLGKLILTK